eukprot:6263979-Amphidinium_carterae.1
MSWMTIVKSEICATSLNRVPTWSVVVGFSRLDVVCQLCAEQLCYLSTSVAQRSDPVHSEGLREGQPVRETSSLLGS